MRRFFVGISLLVAVLVRTDPAWAAGINTDTALAPGEGQFVYRVQLRYLEALNSPGPVDVKLTQLAIPNVLAYGVKEDLTLFGEVPFLLRQGTARPSSSPGVFMDLEDTGVGDSTFFAKYRLWKRDVPGETNRWSVLGGLEVPGYDRPFSSESWNPFVGTVYTYQSLKWGVDLDLGWKFNTGEGIFHHDELFYDADFTYVLLTGQAPLDQYCVGIQAGLLPSPSRLHPYVTRNKAGKFNDSGEPRPF